MKKLFLPLAVLLIFATSCDKNDDNPATPTDPVENLLIGQWSIDPQVVLVDSTQDSIKETPVSVDDSSYANISDTGTVQLGIYIVGNDIFKGAVWQYEMIVKRNRYLPNPCNAFEHCHKDIGRRFS